MIEVKVTKVETPPLPPEVPKHTKVKTISHCIVQTAPVVAPQQIIGECVLSVIHVRVDVPKKYHNCSQGALIPV